jgi:hypothetical protein
MMVFAFITERSAMWMILAWYPTVTRELEHAPPQKKRIVMIRFAILLLTHNNNNKKRIFVHLMAAIMKRVNAPIKRRIVMMVSIIYINTYT